MEVYAHISERFYHKHRFWILRYPYEAGPVISAFIDGYLDHWEWPLMKWMENNQSLRTVAEYYAKYIISAGHWEDFHQASIDLWQE